MPQAILVIDDDPISRTFNASGLRAGGFEAIEAGDGQIGLEMLMKNTVAAIVCDLRMPKMDGIEFVKAVRANEKYKLLPIVLLSAECSPETVQRGTDAGVAIWLQKPVSRSHLVATVTGLLLE